jgi:hypothetical protein
MNTKISVLMPTRGRRYLAERFLASALKHSASPNNIEYILYVDDDDSDSQAIFVENVECKIIVGPRSPMGLCNTRCLEEANGEIIVLVNDDVVIRTVGWDKNIRIMHHSIPDGIYLAYPNDLNKGKGLSAFPILSRKTCELVSQPFPIIYKGAFIDTHLMEIFIRLKKLDKNRIVYMDELIFEHLHFRTGKGKIDQTYKDRNRFADDMIFLTLHKERKNTARYLLNIINQNLTEGAKYKYKEPLIISRPTSFFSMIGLSAKLYLFDPDLPYWNRARNFLYYIARWLAYGMKTFS